MKILLLHHRLPYPLHSGMDKLRYNLIRTLALNHKVTLVVPIDESTCEDSIKYVQNICHNLVTVNVNRSRSIIGRVKRIVRLVLFRTPYQIIDNYFPEMAHKVREICQREDHDIVQALSGNTAGYLKYRKLSQLSILGPHDDAIESTRTKILVAPTFVMKLRLRLVYRAFLYHQPKACLGSDWVFFSSTEDLRRISNLMGGLPKGRVLTVATEADDEILSSKNMKNDSQEPNSIVFVGGFGSLFNADAILYFYKAIFPYILKQIPTAIFYVVGQHPPPEIKSLETSGSVIVTGRVSDVKPYIKRAAVYVGPVRCGTGVKTKMIEALCMGKAIVATKTALSGLWDLPQNVIIVEEDPSRFAEQVVNVLQNHDLRRTIEKRARELYQKSYSFEAVKPKTLNIYDEIENELRCSQLSAKKK